MDSPYFFMIKAFSIFQTAFIFLFYVLPPVFLGKASEADFVAVYPAAVFVNFVVGLILIFTGKKFFKDDVSARFYWYGKDKASFIAKNSWGLICFGGIIVTSVFFQLLGKFLGNETIQRIVFPDEFVSWINFFTGTVCAAAFEEIIYRYLLPCGMKFSLYGLTGGSFNSVRCRVINVFVEFSVVLLFALAHRYLGIIAVLNAFFSGVILRLCIEKTKSLCVNVIVHSAYNFVVFLFLGMIG